MAVRGHPVPPMSRKQIRKVALALRAMLGVSDLARLDLVGLVEGPLFQAGIVYEVLPRSELKGAEAMAWPDLPCLQIREDVYDSLCADEARSRFTIAHEIGHLVLHPGVSLARHQGDASHRVYEDSEWQADTFAAEFLMPAAILQGCCSCEADIESLCGVSSRAARIRYRTLRQEGLI